MCKRPKVDPSKAKSEKQQAQMCTFETVEYWLKYWWNESYTESAFLSI